MCDIFDFFCVIYLIFVFVISLKAQAAQTSSSSGHKECCVCSKWNEKLFRYEGNVVLEHNSKIPWICEACAVANEANRRMKQV